MRIIDHGRLICMRCFVSTAIPQLLLAALIMLGMPAQGEAAPPSADKTPTDTKDAASAKPSNGWGPELDGLRTRLVPAQKDYSIGQPAKFRLEMKNFDVWLAEKKLTWAGNVKKPYAAADYVGKGPDRHIYWIVPASAEKAWPDIRTSIKAALTKEK